MLGTVDGAPDGTNDGCCDGSRLGWLDGTSDGSLDGEALGERLGKLPGWPLGVEDGNTVGVREGVALGVVEGPEDSNTDGMPVGVKLGTEDGAAESSNDGAGLGNDEGSADGPKDGLENECQSKLKVDVAGELIKAGILSVKIHRDYRGAAKCVMSFAEKGFQASSTAVFDSMRGVVATPPPAFVCSKASLRMATFSAIASFVPAKLTGSNQGRACLAIFCC